MATLCERLKLYVVIDPSLCALDPVEVARGAIEGGATVIQLRANMRATVNRSNWHCHFEQ